MRRLRVQVLPVRTKNSPANSLQTRQDQIPAPFMEPCAENDTLEDLYHKIIERYSRLYPHRPPLKIERLLDGYDTVLEVGDLDFKVGDAFSDSEKTESVAKFTVKVVQEPLQRPAQLPLQRYDSIPPNSSARPRKRSLGGNGHNARSSMRDFMRLADEASPERPNEYVNSNKRQRIGLQEERRRDDPDRPILSLERDLGEAFSQRSMGDRNASVVRLVQDSQQSFLNTGRAQRDSHQEPTSPSFRSTSDAVRSVRPEFAAVPDSPPTVIRSSILKGSQPFQALRDEDTKEESPELGQTLHNIPASSFGSPFNGPERAMINNAENFPTPARQPNGHEYTEHDQYLTEPLPSRPQPVAGSLSRKPSLSKPSPQDTLVTELSRPSEVVYKPIRDIYDPLSTETEKTRETPTTPRPKRLKTSGALSTPTKEHPNNQGSPQSNPPSVAHPDSQSRRGSGITESELNWLRTQEKSVCKPSKSNYDFAIDQATTTSDAVLDEEHTSNGVDEPDGLEEEVMENTRKADEEEEERRKKEHHDRERKIEAAEAERIAENNEKRAEQERRDAAARFVAEHLERVKRERIGEKQREQAERDREAEELRLSKQKPDEAAAAAKANEERIAAEAREKAEQKRLAEERKERARQAKERKEQEKLLVARKEEQRVAGGKEAAEEEAAEKEAADKVVAPRRKKANKDDKKAKTVAKESGKKKQKTSPQVQVYVQAEEKDRKANEAFHRARAASVARHRQSSTPLGICADAARDGLKGSSTPLIPGGSRKDQPSPDQHQSSVTPGTSSKGTSLEVQMPLPSSLKQSPSKRPRSVSFVDNEKTSQPKSKKSSSVTTPASRKPILPQGTTEEDLPRASDISSQPKAGSSKTKTPGKARKPVKEETSGGKVQSKLNVIRDTKLKGRAVDPPPRPKSSVQDPIGISSGSEESASIIYSDSDADPRQNGGARAGPSSRATPSSRPASAKANVMAPMRSVAAPTTTTPKPVISESDPAQIVISDNDSIQSFRSDSAVGSDSRPTSRLPARYVSQTPASKPAASRSIATSEAEITSSPPDALKGPTRNSTRVSNASTPSSHVPQSSSATTEKAIPSFQPPSSDRRQSQSSQAPSTQLSFNTSQSLEIIHAQTVERDLEAHLQSDISRSSVQPPSSQLRAQHQNHSSRASAPPKANPNPKPKPTQATKANPTPPTKTPSTASTTRTTRPDPRPNTTSRFPSLTGMKNNPPKWDFKEGAASPMPEFMKPKPKPTATPPLSSSQMPTASLFMSPKSQERYVDLDHSTTNSEDESDSSDNDVTMLDSDGRGGLKAVPVGGGRSAPSSGQGKSKGKDGSWTASTSTPAGTGPRTGGNGSKSKYGSALKRMWPFGSRSHPYEI